MENMAKFLAVLRLSVNPIETFVFRKAECYKNHHVFWISKLFQSIRGKTQVSSV